MQSGTTVYHRPFQQICTVNSWKVALSQSLHTLDWVQSNINIYTETAQTVNMWQPLQSLQNINQGHKISHTTSEHNNTHVQMWKKHYFNFNQANIYKEDGELIDLFFMHKSKAYKFAQHGPALTRIPLHCVRELGNECLTPQQTDRGT